MFTSSLAAEQLQWASKLDTIVSEVSSLSIGAVVFSSKRIDALPADQRALLMDAGKVATAALTQRIRKEDEAAFTRLKGKMTVVTLTSDEKTLWDGIFKQARERLGQSTFSSDLVSKLEALAQ